MSVRKSTSIMGKEALVLMPECTASPDQPGAFKGDIWFGHPEKRNLGTHRWDGAAWQVLPDEIDSVLSLLAAERAKAAWRPMKAAPDDEPCILASSGGYVGEAVKDYPVSRSDELIWRWAGRSEPIHENLYPLLGWLPMPVPPVQPVT